jgi:DNA polymerase
MHKKEIISTLKGYLEMYKEEGIDFFILPKPSICKETASFSHASFNTASKRDLIIELKEKTDKCTQCAELAKGRTNVVFGAGNVNAKLMFVGEAPGREEDVQGLPFVGKAGNLLTKMIEAIGLSRTDVFIANVLKCRPPENRNPFPQEIINCEPYLLKQIEIIQPHVICALGTFAAQTLLKTETPISRLRGEFHDYHGVKLLPTFHPAYLLRNPAEKSKSWADLKMIKKELGI